MVKLNAEQIELINAHGPFNHSVWSNGETLVTNEERLAGRGQFLINLIRKTITERFSRNEISKMSIVDIGCYDGWILHELSDLPFKMMVGVEPRQKNIDKGKFVRDSLGISSKVKMICDDLKILTRQKFDIVLCIGVFHHLESFTEAIRILRKGTNKFIFIETICLSSKYISDDFKREIEMKDIVYKYKNKLCGISGHKYESSYYDGSAMNLSVISIPTIETIMMSMDINFKDIKIEADPRMYRLAFNNYDRNFNAVCITANIPDGELEYNDEKVWFKKYEDEMTTVTLKKQHIEPIYKKIHRYASVRTRITLPNLLEIYLCKNNYISRLGYWLLKRIYRKKSEQEIIRNIKYNIKDKITFEYGKILYYECDLKSSITVLKSLTQKINSDWRCVYRSFYLLSHIYKRLNLTEESNKYMNLYKLSNPSVSK